VPAEAVQPANPGGPEAAEPARVAVLDRTGPDRAAVAERVPDVRDRLLAMLLPDAERALAVVETAEQARDAVRAARRELAGKEAALAAAVEELIAQGLTPAQVRQLLGLTDDESPAG
jgi:chemotaxis regulatin CheY-phosphate phosphatase CheZ